MVGLAGPLARGVHHRQGQLGPGDQDLSLAKPGPFTTGRPVRGEVVAGHDVSRAQVAVGIAVQDDLEPEPATGPGPFDCCCPRQRHAAAAGGTLHLPAAWPWAAGFLQALDRLRALPWCPPQHPTAVLRA